MGCDVQRCPGCARAEVAGVVVQQPDGFRHRGTACGTPSYTWRDCCLGSQWRGWQYSSPPLCYHYTQGPEGRTGLLSVLWQFSWVMLLGDCILYALYTLYIKQQIFNVLLHCITLSPERRGKMNMLWSRPVFSKIFLYKQLTLDFRKIVG